MKFLLTGARAYQGGKLKALDIAVENESPPIVGVPDFDTCQDGPSVYIGCLADSFKIGIISLPRNTVRVSVNKKAKT